MYYRMYCDTGGRDPPPPFAQCRRKTTNERCSKPHSASTTSSQFGTRNSVRYIVKCLHNRRRFLRLHCAGGGGSRVIPGSRPHVDYLVPGAAVVYIIVYTSILLQYQVRT